MRLHSIQQSLWLLFHVLLCYCWQVHAQISVALPEEEIAAEQREIIRIPIAVFLLDDDNDGSLSSARTIDDVQETVGRVNATWYRQAGIEIDPIAMERVVVPVDLLEGMKWQRGFGRDFTSFFRAIYQGQMQDISRLEDEALIYAFYVQSLGGGINGMKPSGVNSFFVVDNPSVYDYRVSSHEIGHLLRLHHAMDSSMLMFSGSNGMTLTTVEQTVARYAAEGMTRSLDNSDR
ncbi:expressed unknown protein [Seminavis robusta]|uniref:Uncharacterized protein n=1 Tax=Seminavis robusta TaxID=568900 RepID=A0A9N8HCV9_9STRA|nr:expressed unknown protein [Seminavis robusta]|eukprot:Sro319_g116150.1 n/a (233) ;mRNA; r:11919-12617